MNTEFQLQSLTVLPGKDKDGEPERTGLQLAVGESVCVLGATGSGKTRLLEDIESIAWGDTPSGRRVLLNGAAPTPEERETLENRLCASLSQSMNFVMELSCREFIRMHLHVRGGGDPDAILPRVMDCANRLAGEAFSEESAVTQLSGGQSRAFMIADLLYVSAAPVVLIDEPENAGIDKHEAIRLLRDAGKLVLISTHDPVLALSCERRLILQNGAMLRELRRTEGERALLKELRRADETLRRCRESLREGETLA